ncbi:sulfate permease [Brevibacterium senegalense]|uniref:sulfate permease n=1 Tax=Brevibacterium senegalense TaxID=1033736 RepID=UPI0011C91146|nr:sulfate permease [Brevibacterium senegalense]
MVNYIECICPEIASEGIGEGFLCVLERPAMLRTSVALSARGYGALGYAPTNLVLNAIRTRRGLKWGVPAMLLAVPYFYAAAICTIIINDGGPSWLYLLVLLLVWNAFKFHWIGPVSLLLMAGRTTHARGAHA